MRLLVALLAAAILHLAGGAASGDGFGSKPHIVVRATLQRPPLRAPLPCSALLSNPRTAHQFFVVDDLGWHNVGWHNPDMITPNADALVAEGIDLDRHCALRCSAARRAPLRSTRLTGS